MKTKVALNSDIHLNMNGLNSEEDFKSYITMLYDWLSKQGVEHYILNGDVSWLKEQVNYYRQELVKQFKGIQFHYTNGNHDIDADNGISTKEYVQISSEDTYHLKNSPIITGDKVILGMDTLFDYSYYNIDLVAENQLTDEKATELLGLTNSRIFANNFPNAQALKELSDACILAAEEMIQEHKGKEIVFVTHYMPKTEFVSPNPQQDMHLALKNAMMGTSKIGEMLERNNVNKCYFGHTHRRIHGEYNGVKYVCQPTGTAEDWEIFSTKKELSNGFVVYSKEDVQVIESYVTKYKPSNDVLNMFLQTIETVQWV